MSSWFLARTMKALVRQATRCSLPELVPRVSTAAILVICSSAQLSRWGPDMPAFRRSATETLSRQYTKAASFSVRARSLLILPNVTPCTPKGLSVVARQTARGAACTLPEPTMNRSASSMAATRSDLIAGRLPTSQALMILRSGNPALSMLTAGLAMSPMLMQCQAFAIRIFFIPSLLDCRSRLRGLPSAGAPGSVPKDLQRAVEHLSLGVVPIGRIQDAVDLVNRIQPDDQTGNDRVAQPKFDGKIRPGRNF